MIIERINNGQVGVAEWFYDFFEAKWDGVVINSIESKLNCLQDILTVLKENDLFKPVVLTFNHERGKEDFQYTLSEPEERDLNLTEFIRSNSIKMQASTEIYFSGTTILLGEERREIVNGAFVILYSGTGVRIITDSDAWLEFDLKGQSQKAIKALNANRLKSSLEAVEKRLGFKPVYDHSKYALVHEYMLENHLWEDGSPMPVV